MDVIETTYLRRRRYIQRTEQLEIEDFAVRYEGGVADPQTIYLPLVAEAAGLFFVVFIISGSSTITVSKHASDAADIIFKDLTAAGASTFTGLTTAGKYAIFYSDGALWYVVAEG